MKPLLFIPSPRNIKEFNEATSKLELDKLWLKYYPQEQAYTRARNWFLEDNKYTHIVILPDDLIVTQHSLDLLIEDAEYHTIISGWCPNTVQDDGSTDSNFSIGHLPPDPPKTNLYHELHFESLLFIERLMRNSVPIIPVAHQGFALTVIPKDVVRHIPFRTSAGCCVDSCLSLDLANAEITQFVDLRARSRHIKTKPDILQVGKAKSEMIFEAC
jgi:hypothetical protein